MSDEEGSGMVPAAPVQASLAAVLFAQNKKLPLHYAVNGKPASPAVARALQKTGFCIFGASKEFVFRLYINSAVTARRFH